MEASSPTNVTELKSYLGLLNCYGKFLPNLATILHPMHDLLQNDRLWKWAEACESAFVKSKQRLKDSSLLVHYDLKKPLRLACDASPYGYFWRLGLDSATGERVSACHVCAVIGKSPPKVPLHPWKWPVKPWERIHINFLRRTR